MICFRSILIIIFSDNRKPANTPPNVALKTDTPSQNLDDHPLSAKDLDFRIIHSSNSVEIPGATINNFRGRFSSLTSCAGVDLCHG